MTLVIGLAGLDGRDFKGRLRFGSGDRRRLLRASLSCTMGVLNN